MSIITLADEAKAVQEFFSRLPDDQLIRVTTADGRGLSILPDPAVDPVIGDWTTAKNHRRIQLIKKEVYETLTPEEVTELADLQEQMLRYRNRVAPLPIAYADQILADLEARLAAKRGS